MWPLTGHGTRRAFCMPQERGPVERIGRTLRRASRRFRIGWVRSAFVGVLSRTWILHRASITARIVILIAGYVLALGAVYAGFSLFLVDRDTTRANERLEQTARLVAAEIDAYVESGRQRLATVTRLPGMTS